MNNKTKNLMQIHFSVLLFGITGIFGKLITLPSIIIVLGRVIFSSLSLYIFLKFTKQDIKLKEKKHYFCLVFMGIILAVHWTTFYQAIKLSTVATALLTFSTFPMFVTFIEPYFFKEKLKISNIITALISFGGIIFIIPNFNLSDNFTAGAVFGIVSGFTYAVLSVLNKKYVKNYSGSVIAFYEQSIAGIILLPFYFAERPFISINNALLLVLLGIIFTAVSHTLFITGLKNIKTQTAGIITTLEPLYGIVCAVFIINEIPSARTIIGGIIILGTVLYSSLKSEK